MKLEVILYDPYLYLKPLGCNNIAPRRAGLVVSVSTSHVVGRGFAPRLGYTKDHHKNDTDCLHAWHAYLRIAVQPNYLKECGTIYGNMHSKDLLGSTSRVGYCIPRPG